MFLCDLVLFHFLPSFFLIPFRNHVVDLVDKLGNVNKVDLDKGGCVFGITIAKSEDTIMC